MDCFKLKPGISKVYDISKEAFVTHTQKKYPYMQIGNDKKERYFAVCPYCDNPMQFIGLFTPSDDGRIYGKHYNIDVPGIALHNEQAYRLCPVASNNYSPPDKGVRKDKMTEYEIEIYNTTREHFDQILYILRNDTGIYFTNNTAEDLAKTFYATRGWMYYWGTLYNIPWTVFYMFHDFEIYGQWIHKESNLAKFLLSEPRFKLEEAPTLEDREESDYYVIRTNSWTETNYMFARHKRSPKDRGVLETMEATLAIKIKDEWKTVWSESIEINPRRFPNLITSSSRNKYIDRKLIDIAEKQLPELKH